MGEDRSTISQAESYRALGEFWDSHDLAEFWDQTKEAEFDVDIQSVRIYYAVDRELAEKLSGLARARGISPETLLNLLVQDKLDELAKTDA